MLLRAYSIFDRKALVYHPPFYAPTDGAAVRSLSDAVADPNTTFNRHPNDYVLFCVGEYDDAKGLLMPCQPLVHVIDAVAVVAQSAAPLFEAPKGQTMEDLRKGLNGEAR